MPLEGRQVSIPWALALCYFVGWRKAELVRAVAVMTAESARYIRAYNVNTNGSIDRGLFQINSIHGTCCTFDAIKNARCAFKLYQEQGFKPWVAYNSGAYKKFMPTIWAAKLSTQWLRKAGLLPKGWPYPE